MEPWEIMISESQERMLAIVAPDCWEGVKAVCDRWDLDATIVGEVTGTRHLRVFWQGEMVGDMDANALAEPPTYDIPQERPAHEVDEPLDASRYPRPRATLEEILLDLIGSPNIASRRWVWKQYDHQVQLNTVIVPGGDAALLRIKKTGAGIAVCTDGNGRQTYLDPYRGGKAAVAEAARNVSCVGAKPIAITNCLNFGNPDNGPIAYQLAQAIQGMAEACEALGTPVISGNVSLYNESFDQPIYPTAVVGMLGLMEDVRANCTIGFKAEGDVVYLLGDATPALDGSEYQKRWFGGPKGRPAGRIPDVDLDAEVALQRLLRETIAARLVRSAHDVSDGGLAVAAAECCIAGGTGAALALGGVPCVGGRPGCAAAAGAAETHAAVAGPLAKRPDLALFGEAPTLVLVSVAAADAGKLEDLCEQGGVPCWALGRVGGGDLAMTLGEEGAAVLDGPDGLRVPVSRLEDVYESALPRAMGD
jgi:phosphoribosylformylglycinamidine synthase